MKITSYMEDKLDKIIPFELLQICNLLIRQTHNKIGYRDLPNLLAQKRNMVTLALIPEAMVSLESIKGITKMKKGIWIFIVLTSISSFFISFWLLLIPFLLFMILRLITLTENKHWSFLASTILGLEILSIDYLNWGSEYPDFMNKAKELFTDKNESPTQLLDYYLPNRDSIDLSLLKQISPVKSNA